METINLPDVLFLSPGREMDAEIAVRLFGWRWFLRPDRERVGLWPPDSPLWIRWNFDPAWPDVTGRESKYERFSDWDRCGSREADRAFLPRYSENIADAWEVVEELRRQGLHLKMNDTLSRYRALFFTVHDTAFHRGKFEDGDAYMFADTAPMAICLAALKAVIERV